MKTLTGRPLLWGIGDAKWRLDTELAITLSVVPLMPPLDDHAGRNQPLPTGLFLSKRGVPRPPRTVDQGPWALPFADRRLALRHI